jgi:hypothetical protein
MHPAGAGMTIFAHVVLEFSEHLTDMDEAFKLAQQACQAAYEKVQPTIAQAWVDEVDEE